jgi:putative endonuclease
MLVWYEEFQYVNDAIQRESSIKNWPRAWKINLIERDNPQWRDLFPGLPGVKPIRGDWHIQASRKLGFDDPENP